MENIIFYSLLLVCIILLFIVGYNFININKLRSNVKFWQESYNDVVKRIKELTKQHEQIELLKSSIQSKEESIKELETELDRRAQTIIHWNEVNYDQVALIQKQADEITILKEQNESLTTHLQDRAKEQKPFNEFENKIETKKTKRKVTVTKIDTPYGNATMISSNSNSKNK